METSRALEILRALSSGVDPCTGEKFPPSSVYQQADTVRALFLAIGTLEGNEKKGKPQNAPSPNAGKPWTEDEDCKLLQAFDGGRSIRDIAAGHGRTINSIPRYGIPRHPPGDSTPGTAGKAWEDHPPVEAIGGGPGSMTNIRLKAGFGNGRIT